MFKTPIIAAIIAAAPFSGSAQAAPKQVAIIYSDLDLSSATGRKELDTRLRRAATRVCFDRHIRDLTQQRLMSECRTAALNSARQQVAAKTGTVQVASR